MIEDIENEMLEEAEPIEDFDDIEEPILYVLNLNEDKRILSACYDNEYIDASFPRVETLPDGDLYEWLYDDGGYIYSPIVEE